MEPQRPKFAISSVYDTLPSPSNLAIWKLTDDPSCIRCGNRATLEHILSSCTKSLADDRYKWRHDHVLEAIASGLDKACKSATTKKQKPGFINFVKTTILGTQPKQIANNTSGLLGMASDWAMQADLRKQLRFPEEIVATNYRPILSYSQGAAEYASW